nr:hypothetical protein [Candidatus Krumholzibacteria bacterium]
YFHLIESRYQRAKVLEYVYLTLNGESPAHACDQNWVCLSWVHDILDILEELPRTGNSDVRQLRQILAWLKVAFSPEDQPSFEHRLHLLFEGMVSAATACIVDELQRLNEGARGKWSVQRQSKNSTRIIHSSKPRTPLYVGIMPNLSIALYNRKRGAQGFDKVLIPFGSNPDQIFNLMDFAARDIYQLHFGENYRLYLGARRRLTSRVVPARAHSRKLFHFVHQHRQEIQLLIPIARRLRRQDSLVPAFSNQLENLT